MATGARRTARPVTPFLGDRQPGVRLPAGGRSSMPSRRSLSRSLAIRRQSLQIMTALRANDVAITQGPVSFGQSGQVTVFVRDPDRNVIELRGREQGVVEGVTRYVP